MRDVHGDVVAVPHAYKRISEPQVRGFTRSDSPDPLGDTQRARRARGFETTASSSYTPKVVISSKSRGARASHQQAAASTAETGARKKALEVYRPNSGRNAFVPETPRRPVKNAHSVRLGQGRPSSTTSWRSTNAASYSATSRRRSATAPGYAAERARWIKSLNER